MNSTKTTVFTILLILVPFFFLFLSELVLRIVVPSPYQTIVSEVSYDNREWYQINRGYLAKFFPSSTDLVPEFKPALFLKNKPENGFRVICLGGSSMFGTPYQMTSTIPGIVRKQLRHLYPELEIEVINFAASAINSQVIKRFAGVLLDFQPDLVLIYMGHNEFYGPDGVGATWPEKNIPGFIGLKYQLKELRIYQVLQKLIDGIFSSEGTLQEPNLMRQVSRGSLVELNSKDSQRIFSDFAKNLAEIIKIYKDEKIPLIVSDVASNLMFKPFKWSSVEGIDDENRWFQSFLDKISTGNIQEGLDSVLTILEKNPANALVNYMAGICYYRLDDFEKAGFYMKMARDHDLLKFRAPGEINEIIADVCRKNQVRFISVQDYLEENSRGGITGYELFWEHLHPKTVGYYLIAKRIVREIRDPGVVESKNSSELHKNLLTLDHDRLSICWLDLAYGDLSIRNLTGKWPFENIVPQTFFLENATPELQQIVMDVYEKKIVWDDGCYRSATYFENVRDFRSAQTTYEAILEEYPYNFYAHYRLARMYKDTGRLIEAASHYRRSIESKPDYFFSLLELGLVEINLGQFDNAIEHLNKGLAISQREKNPGIQAHFYYGLAAAHANKGDLRKALQYAEESLRIFPDYEDARQLREYIRQVISDK